MSGQVLPAAGAHDEEDEGRAGARLRLVVQPEPPAPRVDAAPGREESEEVKRWWAECCARAAELRRKNPDLTGEYAARRRRRWWPF